MQLVFAIVQSEDSDGLCHTLNRHGYLLTRIRSSGAFLAQGNVTVILGVEDGAVANVLDIIRRTCHARRAFMNWGLEAATLALSAASPVEVELGGATVFAVPVHRFVRLRGGQIPPAADARYAIDSAGQIEDCTDLVLAIVRAKDADPVAGGLVEAGFRLTRIPTAGAFLQRPNMTLLCAVPRREVDEVLTVIQHSCHWSDVAEEQRKEMPRFSATVFVIELAQFMMIQAIQ
jgi:uncharacterized protein YaaQ